MERVEIALGWSNPFSVNKNQLRSQGRSPDRHVGISSDHRQSKRLPPYAYPGAEERKLQQGENHRDEPAPAGAV